MIEASEDGKRRIRLLVRGIVQGVGFRPYVYRLATMHQLTGFVLNSSAGVVIEVEGPTSAVAGFIEDLPIQGPPLMQIVELERKWIALEGSLEFVIRSSAPSLDVFALVPPDICVCDDCLAETRDPAGRRFEYPFTNCTNCGPRYSIIRDVPYDRSQTTMAEFTMCEDCQAEYDDPGDRRFHAQPNACPVCGPHVFLQGQEGTTRGSARQVLEAAAEVVQSGGIVAWKGLGGYQLICDARRQSSVEELRRRKRRSEKPFALMVADAAAAASFCLVSPAEHVALVSRERPIVLLERRPHSGLAEAVSPGNPTTGIMLPATPMHELLFRILREKVAGEPALVMTSGNLSEEPIVIDITDAEARLATIADVFVHHNRGIHTRVDDSIVRVLHDPGSHAAAMVLRRARGYAPQPIWLGDGDMEVLACGAQQKSTFCLTKSGFALPSQHLGDLENFETLEYFEETLARMRRLFHVDPTVVAHDLHPGYLSTQLAKKMTVERVIAVQHHHAHIASCMAEHRLRGKVIGLAWDGTGYGTDGTIWGGEFLVADLRGFERFGHLRTVPLAGGDTAVREPWRVARAYLYDAGISGSLASSFREPGDRVRLVDAMIDRRINTLDTSSCGRLFDAVAALIGLRHTASFEGQAAMALEAIADNNLDERYDFAIEGVAPAQVDLRAMIQQIVKDVEHGEPSERISARFHNTLVAVAVEMCRRMRDRHQLSRVCLSGGCFQNLRLLSGCVQQLRGAGFEVFYQREIPANDGGISLGQAAIACELASSGTTGV